MHCAKDYQEIRRLLNEIFAGEIPTRLQVKARAIRDRRTELDLSGNRLSELTGVDQPTINRLENRRLRSATPDKLLALASHLQLELADIAILSKIDWERVRDKTDSLSRVRTLMRPREWTDLRSFFYPARLIEDRDDATHHFTVEAIGDFESTLVALIGIAGQGKSVLLRWLCLKEVERERRIPVFIELRRLGDRTVWDAIVEELADISPGLVAEKVCTSCEIVLLLDAFDEILVERREDVAAQVVSIHKRYPKLQIVVTSRPDSGIVGVPDFFRYAILELQPCDFLPVVQKYATETEAREIAQRVDDCFAKVANVLTTPLLVVLLVLHFRHTKVIPDSTIAFYRDLLDVLVNRHNQSEWGLKRKSVAGLDYAELASVFEALAFSVSRDYGDEPIHRSELQRCMSRSLTNLLRFDRVQPGIALNDVIEITNLIADENGICSYLHRSIREYHAAAFIAGISDTESQRFYTHALVKWKSWSGVLDFLEHLDSKRFLELFQVPEIERLGEPTQENILESYTKVTLFPVSESIVRVAFSDSNTKTFDQFRIGGIVMDYERAIRNVFNSELAEQIMSDLSNSQPVAINLTNEQDAKSTVHLSFEQRIVLCPNTNIENLADHANERLSLASGFQVRESEFDV